MDVFLMVNCHQRNIHFLLTLEYKIQILCYGIVMTTVLPGIFTSP